MNIDNNTIIKNQISPPTLDSFFLKQIIQTRNFRLLLLVSKKKKLATASSGSMIRRLVPFFAARIRENHLRLLTSSSSAASSALRQQSPPPQLSDSPSPSQSQPIVAVHMTENCVRRMRELQSQEGKEKMLRLSIEAGGCSGFQYNFSLDDNSNDNDRIFEREGVKLVVDKISLDFVKGATVDYVEELIRSAFQVSTNPSAVGGCSCKSSFMV